jgi:hypothetical protein
VWRHLLDQYVHIDPNEPDALGYMGRGSSTRSTSPPPPAPAAAAGPYVQRAPVAVEIGMSERMNECPRIFSHFVEMIATERLCIDVFITCC